ncbi:MAG: RDD family protein, partial [Solirubrobacteraceae bacterium]
MRSRLHQCRLGHFDQAHALAVKLSIGLTRTTRPQSSDFLLEVVTLLSLIKGRIPGARGEPKLTVASLQRRFLASLIDALVGILTMALVIGTGVLAFVLGRKRGIGGRFLRNATSSSPDISRRLSSPPSKLILNLITLVVSASYKQRRRSPGFRILGLRLVDVRTGGELSRHQEVIRATTRQAWRVVCRRLIPAPKPRVAPDHERLKLEIEVAR